MIMKVQIVTTVTTTAEVAEEHIAATQYRTAADVIEGINAGETWLAGSAEYYIGRHGWNVTRKTEVSAAVLTDGTDVAAEPDDAADTDGSPLFVAPASVEPAQA